MLVIVNRVVFTNRDRKVVDYCSRYPTVSNFVL